MKPIRRKPGNTNSQKFPNGAYPCNGLPEIHHSDLLYNIKNISSFCSLEKWLCRQSIFTWSAETTLLFEQVHARVLYPYELQVSFCFRKSCWNTASLYWNDPHDKPCLNIHWSKRGLYHNVHAILYIFRCTHYYLNVSQNWISMIPLWTFSYSNIASVIAQSREYHPQYTPMNTSLLRYDCCNTGAHWVHRDIIKFITISFDIVGSFQSRIIG